MRKVTQQSSIIPLVDEDFLSISRWAITHAEKSILLSTFLFNLTLQQDVDLRVRSIAKLLGDAAWRGVAVKVLMGVPQGRDQLHSNTVAAHFLARRSIEVRMLDHPVHHLKCMVVDNNIALVGSHNCTPSALSRNFEASVLVNDTQMAMAATDIFYGLWKQSEACNLDSVDGMPERGSVEK